jgi:hypothetical protein
MGESEGLTFDLITRTSVTLYEVGWEDAFQVGVLGEGGHRRSDLVMTIRASRSTSTSNHRPLSYIPSNLLVPLGSPVAELWSFADIPLACEVARLWSEEVPHSTPIAAAQQGRGG